MLPQPHVAPTRSGGVLLEWEQGPHQLEIQFDDGERGSFVYVNRETGVSVTRLAITSAARLLRLVAAVIRPLVRVWQSARVGDIRAWRMCVVPRPVAEDPGHAEIQSGAASLDEHLTRRKLANLFRLLPESPTE